MTKAFTTDPPVEAGAEEHPPRRSRAFKAAQELRLAAIRQRRSQSLVFLAAVILSILAFAAWGVFVARPRYPAETHFSVRGAVTFPQPASTSTPVTSMISTGQQPLSSSVGFTDGFAANDFIKSRDCMLQVASRIDLRSMLDLPKSASEQTLYAAYQDAVASRFDMVEQINVVTVSAFSPDKSRRIADALLAVTQDFVEKEDDIGAKNMLRVSLEELEKAQDAAQSAKRAMASWRIQNGDLDPQAQATMLMTLIGQIEQQLSTAQVNYEKVRALGDPNQPMLQPARLQVVALQNQLTDAHRRLTGGHNSLAQRLRTYTRVKANEDFADANLSSAQAFYLQALHDVTIMRRFLSVLARPIPQTTPSSPVLWLLVLEGFIAGLILGFVALVLMKFVRRERERTIDRTVSESLDSR